MEIKKNGTLGAFSGIQKQNNELPVEESKNKLIRQFLAKLDAGENKESLGIDKVRSQVMNLHGEVKDIQTNISIRQIQIAFLDKLPADSDWKSELQSFMQEKFSNNVVLKPDPDLETYIKRLSGEIRVLNNDMLTREVKLENIVSSGIADSELSDISSVIIKDIRKASEVFSKMKTENIIRVLKV